MNFVALGFNILFFGIGLYVYLFAIGRLKNRDPEIQKRADAFRLKNHWWLRLTGLALAAISLVNIVLDIQAMLL